MYSPMPDLSQVQGAKTSIVQALIVISGYCSSFRGTSAIRFVVYFYV